MTGVTLAPLAGSSFVGIMAFVPSPEEKPTAEQESTSNSIQVFPRNRIGRNQDGTRSASILREEQNTVPNVLVDRKSYKRGTIYHPNCSRIHALNDTQAIYPSPHSILLYQNCKNSYR